MITARNVKSPITSLEGTHGLHFTTDNIPTLGHTEKCPSIDIEDDDMDIDIDIDKDIDHNNGGPIFSSCTNGNCVAKLPYTCSIRICCPANLGRKQDLTWLPCMPPVMWRGCAVLLVPCQVILQPPDCLPMLSAPSPVTSTRCVGAKGKVLSRFFNKTSDSRTAWRASEQRAFWWLAAADGGWWAGCRCGKWHGGLLGSTVAFSRLPSGCPPPQVLRSVSTCPCTPV